MFGLYLVHRNMGSLLLGWFIFACVAALLFGCAATTETGAVACRGTAFAINPAPVAPLALGTVR